MLRSGGTGRGFNVAQNHDGTMNLHHLRIFQVVVKHLNFSRAADELLISQSAVSMHVKSLESAFGLPLFEKTGHRIKLTDAGLALWEYSHKIFGVIEETRQVLEGMKSGNIGHLRVSADTTVGVYVVPEYLGQFRRAYPRVSIMLDVANRTRVIDKIIARESDLAVMGQVPDDGEDWDATPFMDNELVVIAPPDHPLARGHEVPASALAGEAWLVRESGSGTRAAMERYFEREGVRYHVSMELGNNSTIKQSVANGLGIAVISAKVIQLELQARRLIVLPVQGFPLKRSWYVAHLRGRFLPQPAQAFKALLVADYHDKKQGAALPGALGNPE